jgi:tRNA(Ile)-lysidine synthetase-like protein
VLPSLRLFYPGIDDALIRIRESAHAQFVRAERATEGRVPEYLRLEGREWRLSLDALAGLDEDYRLHVLARVIEKIGIRDVTGVHYRAMLAGSSVDVPGWHVRPEHDGLVFMPRSAARSAAPRPLHVPGTTFIADWTFRAAPVRNAAAHDLLQNRPHEVALLAADGPFTVRFAQPGDRMRPFGMRGHKKLSDLFIDRKIPRRKRSRIPVIEANGEILWVAGIATSELARIQPGSARVVRIVAGRSHD